MDGLGVTPVSIPAQVRADGPEGRKLYEVAVAFESILLRRLSETIQDGPLLGGDETDAASSSFREQAHDAFAQSLASNGGLGLADQLYASLREGLGR